MLKRRFHIEHLAAGVVRLGPRQSRHLRDVLRIGVGEAVELFDDAGRSAAGVVLTLGEEVELEVQSIAEAPAGGVRLVVAAAVPKGPRADWMVEKLSELGVERYIPLETARGVVHPEAGKLQRWERIAEESAKQCKRNGVMQIQAPTAVKTVCAAPEWAQAARWCMAAGGESVPVLEALPVASAAATVLAMVGPEGGWAEAELELMRDSRFHRVRLTRTILRIETAALALAAVVMAGVELDGKELV